VKLTFGAAAAQSAAYQVVVYTSTNLGELDCWSTVDSSWSTAPELSTVAATPGLGGAVARFLEVRWHLRRS